MSEHRARLEVCVLRSHRATLTSRLLREALLLRLAQLRGELPAASPALLRALDALDALATEAAAVEREAAPFLRCRTFPRVPAPRLVANDQTEPMECT